MKGNRIQWIPFMVLFAFALTGTVSAIRHDYFLSGIFALYFVGYSIIRISLLLKDPLPLFQERLRPGGYLLIIVATFFFVWQIVDRVLLK